jgi:hypothetical protein
MTFTLGFGQAEEFGVFEQEQDQFRPHVRISGASARKMTETAKKHLDRNLFRRPTERNGYFQSQPGHRGVEETRGLDLNLNTVATFDSHVGEPQQSLGQQKGFFNSAPRSPRRRPSTMRVSEGGSGRALTWLIGSELSTCVLNLV